MLRLRMQNTQAQQACPRCGTQVPVHRGYVTWCHDCGWNVAAPATVAAPTGRLGRLYAGVGRRVGDRLAGELRTRDSLEPRLTPSKFLAYVIAAGVYLGALAFAAAGILLLALGFPNPFAIAVAVILLAFAILMRPRLGKPPDEQLVTRDEAPRLHEIVAEVARALETPSIDLLQAESNYNASWATLGLRRRRVLALGLPLITALEPQERVALIAHELAHARNGDSTRSFFMGSAIRGLDELYGLLAPNEFLYEVENPDLGPIERVANWLLWLISRPVLGILLVQLHLVMRDSQRAEYLADALAAKVAGTEAAVSLQEKLLLEPTFLAVVQHAARPGVDSDTDLFEELAAAVVAVPPRERDRRRRVARLEEARLSDTHPPTAKRIELMESRPQTEPIVVLREEDSRTIDAELAGRRQAAQHDLIDEYRDSLYAG
jgi:Zn-dependent protease with chaperone function